MTNQDNIEFNELIMYSEIKSFSNKQFQIVNHKNECTTDVKPIAVESCMVPGTFHITPVILEMTETQIIFSVGNEMVSVQKDDFEKGFIDILPSPFEPVVYRNKNSCNPCTNCGRCSW